MADIYLPLLLGATVYFAQPDALRVSLSVHTDLTSYYPLPPPTPQAFQYFSANRCVVSITTPTLVPTNLYPHGWGVVKIFLFKANSCLCKSTIYIYIHQ